MNLFKFLFTMLVLTTVTSCEKDPCEDVVCDPGMLCDGSGTCVASVDQKIAVEVEFQKGKSYSATNRVKVKCETQSDMKTGSVVFADGTIVPDEFIYSNSTVFSHGSGGFMADVPLKSSSEFMGETTIALNFDDINTTKTSFSFELNIDTVNMPIIILSKVNEELIISWTNADNAEYTKIKIYGPNSGSNNDFVFEYDFSSVTTTNISSSSSGWIDQNGGFIDGENYRVYVLPSIKKTFSVDNIDYTIVSNSLDTETIVW